MRAGSPCSRSCRRGATRREWGAAFTLARRSTLPLCRPCGHIFCRPCAERRFSSTNTCSLCDAALDLESELVELTHERSAEVGLATFALCATFPEEAWRIFVEASVFCRTQTALYGTREIWIRAKETEVRVLL